MSIRDTLVNYGGLGEDGKNRVSGPYRTVGKGFGSSIETFFDGTIQMTKDLVSDLSQPILNGIRDLGQSTWGLVDSKARGGEGRLKVLFKGYVGGVAHFAQWVKNVVASPTIGVADRLVRIIHEMRSHISAGTVERLGKIGKKSSDLKKGFWNFLTGTTVRTGNEVSKFLNKWGYGGLIEDTRWGGRETYGHYGSKLVGAKAA